MPRAEPAGRALRADARRNRELIVAAAEEVFLQDGENASLEEIARRAGVGSATLHRHFPTRKNLLETVYLDHVKELCDAAGSLAAEHEAAAALIAWLRLVDARAAVNNGLAAAIAADEDAGTSGSIQSCHAMVAAAGGALLEEAIGAGAVRSDIDIRDLLAMVSALARSGGAHGRTPDNRTPDNHPPGRHPPENENRLLMLALTGIVTRPGS